jgi:hypothetical protein
MGIDFKRACRTLKSVFLKISTGGVLTWGKGKEVLRATHTHTHIHMQCYPQNSHHKMRAGAEDSCACAWLNGIKLNTHTCAWAWVTEACVFCEGTRYVGESLQAAVRSQHEKRPVQHPKSKILCHA